MVLPLRVSSYSISMRSGGTGCARAAAAKKRLVSGQYDLRIVPLDVDHAVSQSEPAIEEPAHGARIDDVLLFQHARSERRGVVAGAHRHRRLRHDRPVVELRGDEMHGAAVD